MPLAWLSLQLHGLLEKEGKVNVELSQRLERQQARAADLQKSLEVCRTVSADLGPRPRRWAEQRRMGWA